MARIFDDNSLSIGGTPLVLWRILRSPGPGPGAGPGA